MDVLSQGPVDVSETVDPRDAMSQDDILIAWQYVQSKLASAKKDEIEWRNYVAKRAFPEPKEGTNILALGNGYILKAVVNYHYNLLDNDVVESTLNKIAKIGNQGAFVADRLVSWTPNFLKTEYTKLKEDAEAGSLEAKEMLKLVNEMLVITDAAPKVEIKEPRKGKK